MLVDFLSTVLTKLLLDLATAGIERFAKSEYAQEVIHSLCERVAAGARWQAVRSSVKSLLRVLDPRNRLLNRKPRTRRASATRQRRRGRATRLAAFNRFIRLLLPDAEFVEALLLANYVFYRRILVWLRIVPRESHIVRDAMERYKRTRFNDRD
jgi:hypothetical protein